MRQADVDQLADAIADRLAYNIPAALPERIATGIRDLARHGTLYERHTFVVTGPAPLGAEYTLSPDGRLTIRLHDAQLCPFWQGTLRPAAELRG